MGGQDFIYSQRSGVAETLFKGDLLGVDADVVADLRARGESSRDLSFIRGAYHVPERFLERFATHVAKNLLVNDDDDDDDDDGTTREKNTTRRAVGLRAAGRASDPRHLGRKGLPHTFTRRALLPRHGHHALRGVRRRAGGPRGGRPAPRSERLRRRRRRRARRGSVRPCSWSARPGRRREEIQDDKVTVNNQIVQASLMNLCDTPTAVALGDPKRADRRAWDSREERVVANDGDERADTRKRFGSVKCRRVPIVVTGNDFSRLNAILTRSGRMDLWHWSPPSRSEIAAMLHATLAPAAGEDAGTFGYGGEQDARALVARFPDQPVDFLPPRAASARGRGRARLGQRRVGSKREKRNVSVSITARRRPPRRLVARDGALRASPRSSR